MHAVNSVPAVHGDLFKPHRTILMGVGGGGGNAAAHLARTALPGIDLVTVNTDLQALSTCEGTQRIPIGGKVTEGLGAGGDPALGRLAAEEDKEVLRDALFGVKLAVLIVGLGGGTGTGAAPFIAQLAREEGALTVCFAMMPFALEGEKRMRQAEEGLRLLVGHCDVVVRLPNEHLLAGPQRESSLEEAFAVLNDMLGTAVHAFSGIISETGVINLDFSDIRQAVERSGGLCACGYGEGSGKGKAVTAVNGALKHPLLAGVTGVEQSAGLLVNILGGDDLTLADVQEVMNRIKEKTRSGADILLGAVIKPGWSDRLAVTVLVPQPQDVQPGAPKADETTADRRSQAAVASAVELAGARPARGQQTSLPLDGADKGRFKNVEPTIYEGEDLDVPTYVRRGVKLSTDKASR